jgi:hypothetical protein
LFGIHISVQQKAPHLSSKGASALSGKVTLS